MKQSDNSGKHDTKMQTQQLQTKSFLCKNEHSKTIKSNKKVIISHEVV